MSRTNESTPSNDGALLSSIMRRIKDPTARKAARRVASDYQPSDNSVPLEAESRAAPVKTETVLGSADKWPLPGLAPMTRVRTAFGDVHAIALRKGDKVRTRSGEYKSIVWLNRVLLDERFLSDKPDSNPVLLHAGSVARGVPAADIMVSPRQIICPVPQGNMDRAREAADMLSRPGVMRRRETGLSYTMFHLGEASEVLCEGVYLRFDLPMEICSR
jgi:hypothetical protein